MARQEKKLQYWSIFKTAQLLNTTPAAVYELRRMRKLTPHTIMGGVPICDESEIAKLKQHPRVLARAARLAGKAKG